MAASAAFAVLEARVELLRKLFLPDEFDPTGSYSDEQTTRTFAFRLLAHAEIEGFLEDRAKELAKIALAGWRTSRRPSTTLVALMAFSGLDHRPPPPTLSPPQPSKAKSWPQEVDLDERVAAAVTAFNRRMSQNHGIKEENLLRILMPIGLGTDDIDQTLLAELNSLGSDRGATAHSSGQHVTTIPDPKNELERVRRILEGLEGVDTTLGELESEAAQADADGEVGA